MSLLITRAGLQSTVQARPRVGQRHLGVPASGPADALSMALANRLLGNVSLAAALEITLTGLDLQFAVDCSFAVCGASSDCTLNGSPAACHRATAARAGDELHIGAAMYGARAYLAVAGGIAAGEVLGSASTYLPAGLGGHHGRALQSGDRIELRAPGMTAVGRTTPAEFRPPMSHAWAVRACDSADIGLLEGGALYDTNFTIGARADRMGLQLQGSTLRVRSTGRQPSAPVFPGTVQCPEDGTPYLLCVDAQTTGGYPRMAQVIRADRHVLGQCRPQDHIRLLRRTPEEATAELQEKLDYWRRWLPDIETVVY